MIRLSDFNLFSNSLSTLDGEKKLITTLNAHSFNIAREDSQFAEALQGSDVLLPDGVSIIWALHWLDGRDLRKIAGADLFFYEMERLQERDGRCFFLGSSTKTLERIKKRAAQEYPDVEVGYYSPPYKPRFSEEDSAAMIEAVNNFKPDVLFIGLTAPKQEKWAYEHYDQLNAGHICCIGAVFDFYAGTINRAPEWMINLGLEWLYRLIREPGRMWRRYLIGNFKFIGSVFAEKIKMVSHSSGNK